MKYLVIYDDRWEVSADVQRIVGAKRFSSLRFKRRTLHKRFREMADSASCDAIETVSGEGDAQSLLQRGNQQYRGWRVLYWPSCVVIPNDEQGLTFINKLRFGQDSFVIAETGHGRGPAMLAINWDQAEGLISRSVTDAWQDFYEYSHQDLRSLNNQVGVSDLLRRENILSLLSGTFDARHFNDLIQSDWVVRKQSRDRDKMRREAAVYNLLPAAMKPFFLPALDYVDDGSSASYTTERIYVPDLALQWIHQAIDEDSFDVLLTRLSGFVQERVSENQLSASQVSASQLSASRPTNGTHQTALLLDKVDQRLANLLQTPVGKQVEYLLQQHCPAYSLTVSHDRYRNHWHRLGLKKRPRVVSHGDLCFSNILFDSQTKFMKFIDPRGGDSLDDLLLDPIYDIAKLSHSITGLYDFINHDLFEISFGPNLELSIKILAPNLESYQLRFYQAMEMIGFSRREIRVAECSLFLSMLPLHADIPKKVLGFAMTAGRILDELDG